MVKKLEAEVIYVTSLSEIKKETNRQDNVKKKMKNENVLKSEKALPGPSGKLKRNIKVFAESHLPAKKAKLDADAEEPLHESENEGPEMDLPEKEENLASEFYRPNITCKHLEGTNEFVLSEDCDVDLFCTDEYNGRFDQYTQFNFMFRIFDEIALEGLDGITLEALWKRLKHCLKFPTILDNLKTVIWKLICGCDKIKLYKLPEPRGELIINDVLVLTEEGALRELYAPSIYEYGLPPKDAKEQGVCSTYTTRIDVSDDVRQMAYLDVYYSYGNSLVIVADQEVRTYALFDFLSDPTREVIQNEYCLLEKIGRSRNFGELSLGANSIHITLKLDPRSTYYYKKQLIANRHIVTQKITISGRTDQSKHGQLFQLRRFYNKRKPKNELIHEAIVNYLKTQPGHRMLRSSVYKLFGVNGKFVKNMTTSSVAKYINLMAAPYRIMYPNAPKSEYMSKHKKEKHIQVLELLDPCVNIGATSNEADVEFSADEDDDEEISSSVGTRSINVDLQRDVYLTVYRAGINGIYMKELLSHFNVGFYTMRQIFRRLTERKCVQTKKVEIAKTLSTKFIATCHLENNSQPTSAVCQQKKSTIGNKVLEKLKAKQQQAINAAENPQIYTKQQFLEDQDLLMENNIFLPVVYPVPNIKCTYLVQIFRILNIEERTFVEGPKPKFSESRKNIKLELSVLNYTEHDVIKINRLWSKFNEIDQVIKLDLKANFTHAYKDKRKMDSLTMLFLLRALFEELEIKKTDILNTLDSTGYFAKDTASVEKKEEKISNLPQGRAASLNFMGNNPTTIYVDKKDDILTEVIESTPPKNEKPSNLSTYHPAWSTTERMTLRAKQIVEIITQCRVLEEFVRLNCEITASESKEGYTKKIDRKSVIRIIKHLTEDGLIKVLIVNIKKGDLVKTKKYVCVPEETYLHPFIQSQIEQIKHRFFMTKAVLKSDLSEKIIDIDDATVAVAGPSNVEENKDVKMITEPKEKLIKAKKSPFVVTDVLESLSKFKELQPASLKNDIKVAMEKKKKQDSNFARKYYGLVQKCVRYSVVHEILYYLIYDQPKNAQQLSKNEVRDLFKEYQITLLEEDIDSLPPIYCKELSWKMFVPPLPKHVGWPEGWALVCDIVLRLPLAIIFKTYNCTTVSRELVEVLNHPIKRFFLLGYHSDHIKNLLGGSRKNYILNLYHLICFLAYLGLVQFGPSKLHHKDQIFIYLNRKASLLNTVTSAPGYHKVEEKEYPRVSFVFNSALEVANYWSTMFEISMNTRLNSSNAVKGRTITIHTPKAQADLQKSLIAKTPKEAFACDTGMIPGDQRGACGLDSSLFVHISHNWTLGVSSKRRQFSPFSPEKKEVPPSRMNYSNLQKKDHTAKKIYLPKRILPVLPKTKRTTVGKRGGKPEPSCASVRTKYMHGYPKKNGRKRYYDNLDLKILKKSRPGPGYRAKIFWTEDEDRILILLKVATILLTKIWGLKQIINFVTIRDALHIIVPSSAKTKTSRAVERRFRIIFNRYKKLSKYEMNIPNLIQLEPIARYIEPLMGLINDKEKPLRLTQPQLANAYIFLMSYIAKNIPEVEAALQGARVARTDHLSKTSLSHTEENLIPFNKRAVIYKKPQDKGDLVIETLKAALVSALSCRALLNESYWSYLVFNTYQKFSNGLIKKCVDYLVSKQLISKNKFNKRSQMQFVLSSHYVYAQNSTYSFKILDETYKMFSDLLEGLSVSFRDLTEIHMSEKLAISEMATFWWTYLNFKIQIPDYPIILDPAIEDHSEIIDELAKRYQIKLNNEKELKALRASQSADLEQVEIKTETPDLDIIDITDEYEEQTTHDLTFKSGNTVNMTDLRNWIEGCIDVDRSRSPSPERIINREPLRTQETEDSTENNANEFSDLNIQSEERILSIEEIKEEMMEDPSTTKKRTVPYVLDLIDLLSENFEEIDSDMEALKKHLVSECPVLEEVNVENIEELKNHHLVKFLEDELRREEVWSLLETKHHVGPPLPLQDVHEILIQNGCLPNDISLLDEIVNFVALRGHTGAEASDIRARFVTMTDHLPLEYLLSILTSKNVLIQTGVCSIVFVHHLYKDSWLLNVSLISNEEQQFLENSKIKDAQERVLKMEENKESRPTLDIKVHPWILLDGQINIVILKIWLSNILSHCIENPKVWFKNLYEKYFMLKPLDVYALLEILKDLGCVRICRYESNNKIFSEWNFEEVCEATVLDSFDDIFIEPSIVCCSTFGSFFFNKT